MATEKEYQDLYDRVAGLREELVRRLGTELISNPSLGDALVKQVDEMLASVEAAGAREVPPPDKGLAALVGIGPQAAQTLGETRLPHGVVPYDETVTSERIIAVGDRHQRAGLGQRFSNTQADALRAPGGVERGDRLSVDEHVHRRRAGGGDDRAAGDQEPRHQGATRSP